jgi:hypothetical protein
MDGKINPKMFFGDSSNVATVHLPSVAVAKNGTQSAAVHLNVLL